ncbi:uncharacterized protein [Aphelocoma coerulescens]|uniref:uncharacterized protein n=1 Tax=Aphelocoma coerulescens TaxID=39617 RepID=UPI003604BE2F
MRSTDKANWCPTNGYRVLVWLYTVSIYVNLCSLPTDPADTLDARPRLCSRGEHQALSQHLPLLWWDPRRFFPRVPFQFPLRVPRSSCPASKRLPSGRRSEGSGRWPLRTREDAATPGSPALAGLGSPGGPAGEARSCLAGAGVGRCADATVPRHVEGREEPAFPPGTVFSGMGREQRTARLGCLAGLLALQLLPGAGARVGERLREQQKIDLKVQEVREQWFSLPRQPVLTRRLHVGGKLQTSVENSNTPGTSKDKSNNNDNNDNVFPYIKAQKINILLHPLPPWSPDLLNALSFQYFGGWSRFERGTLSGRVKAGGDVTRVPFTFSREHNHCPCDKNLCYGLGALVNFACEPAKGQRFWFNSIKDLHLKTLEGGDDQSGKRSFHISFGSGES